MIFKSKDDLNFLSLFDIARNSSTGNAKDKLKITSEKGKTYFSLYSNELIVINELDSYDNDMDIIIDIEDFYSVIKNIPANKEIELVNNVLKFGETEYTFEIHSIVLPDYKEYLDTIKNNSPSSKITNLNLSSNLAIALNFIGQRDTTSIEYFNNHFVATNKVKACLLKDKNNSSDEHLIFSPNLCSFIDKAKMKELSIDIYNDESIQIPYYCIPIENTYVISSIPNNTLPNLFDERYIVNYTHPTKIEVSVDEVKEALKRMRIVTKFDSLSNGIDFTIQDGKLILNADDTKSTASARESINAEVDSPLVGFYTRFNSSYLYTILSFIDSPKVRIYVSNNDKFLVAKITDESEDNIFLLTRLNINK